MKRAPRPQSARGRLEAFGSRRNFMSRKNLWLLLPAALALTLGGALFVDAYGHAQRPARGDAIVVLGARVLPNGRASNALRERVAQAVALYKAGLAPVIICTGGVGDFPPAESVVAAELARKLGVPRTQVLAEDESVSTRQNARFAARICRAHGWKRVILVSQPYHLLRARLLFEREGLSTSASPVPRPRVDDSVWQRALWSIREALLSLRDAF